MANEAKTTSRTKRAKTASVETSVMDTIMEENISNEVYEQPEQDDRRKFVAKDVDVHQYITVKNGFRGPLIYKSKRTGETFKWDDFGDEQEIELAELKSAKTSSKKFFTNNWFMFDDSWVIDYLGMNQYYKNAIPIDGFDDIFVKDAEELESLIRKLSDGQKKIVAYRARQLVSEGEIDSNRVIKTLESSLGIELVER